MTSADFIGQGFGFPMRVDHTGKIALAAGDDAIAEGIISVLSTAPGERVMRPSFGCTIWDMLFDPINASTLGRMEDAVRDAVAQWEPRVALEEVEVSPDPQRPGSVQIALEYRILATNDVRNLVYPFYVIPEEGEA